MYTQNLLYNYELYKKKKKKKKRGINIVGSYISLSVECFLSPPQGKRNMLVKKKAQEDPFHYMGSHPNQISFHMSDNDICSLAQLLR